MVQQLQLRPNLNRFGLLIGAFFFWLSALFCTVSAADLLPIPEVAYVTDTAHLLTAEQKRSLEAKLAGFEEKYGSQIAVIIVPSTNGEPIEDYAHRVGDNWKLGRKDVGDGLLLIVAVNDHRIRIDVMRALEGAIPDVAASRIITDVMAPNFRQNNYYQGISQALDKVFTLIEDAKLPAPQKKRAEANILYDPAEALWDEPWVAVLFIGFVITMMLRVPEVKACAKEHGVSVTELLCAAMMQALDNLQAEKVRLRQHRKPVKVTVPVNLRNLFPSHTLRNFASYVNVEIDPRLGSYTFEEICQLVHHTMGLGNDAKAMRAKIATNVASEKSPVLRVMPLFVKNIAMKAVFDAVGECKACLCLSNLGVVQVPQIMRPYIRRIDFVIGPQANAPHNCGIATWGDTMYVSCVRNIKEPELELHFYRVLQSLGLHVTVESNAR